MMRGERLITVDFRNIYKTQKHNLATSPSRNIVIDMTTFCMHNFHINLCSFIALNMWERLTKLDL